MESSSSEYELTPINLFKKNREAMGVLGLPIPPAKPVGYMKRKVPRVRRRLTQRLTQRLTRRIPTSAAPELIGNAVMNRMAQEAAVRRATLQRMQDEEQIRRNTTTVRKPRHMAKKSWTRKFIENEKQRAIEAAENAEAARRLMNLEAIDTNQRRAYGARYTQKRKNQHNAWRQIANLEAAGKNVY